jgi:hypothetical protein
MTEKVTIVAYNRCESISEEEIMEALMPLGLSDIYIEIKEG